MSQELKCVSSIRRPSTKSCKNKEFITLTCQQHDWYTALNILTFYKKETALLRVVRVGGALVDRGGEAAAKLKTFML